MKSAFYEFETKMKFFFLFSAFLFFSAPASAINSYVNSGDTADGGVVNQVVNQYVSGTSQNQTVYGNQYVQSGGNAYNTSVYGSQTVQSGGNASGTVVQSYGMANISGQAENFTVKSGATMNVNSGGTASGTNVTGGTLYVLNGGNASGTVLSSGKMYTRSGGSDTATVINGGTQQVVAGGISSGTKIYNGFQQVYGTAENTVLYGGSQSIMRGATFSSGTVDGGSLTVYSSSSVNGLTVYSGDVLANKYVTFSGTTTLAGGNVDAYGGVRFENLVMNNGRVSVMPTTLSESISITNLSGAGNFYLNSEVDVGNTDKLIIGSASGTYNIALIDYSATEVFPQNISLIELGSGNADFHLIGGAADIGAFRYNMERNGNEWVLKRTPIFTDSSIVAKNTFVSIQSVFYAHQNNLNSHIQDIRSSKRAGFWAKGFRRKVNFDFSDNSESKTNIWGGQIGFDFRLPQKMFDYMIVGAYWGHSNSRQRFDRDGMADADTNSVGLYTTMHIADGFFVNADVAYYRHSQNLTSYLPMGMEVLGHYKTNGWSAAVQTGKRFLLKNVWFVEPELKLTYMKMDSIRYRTTMNTSVYGRNADSFMGKVGVTGGRNMSDVLGIQSEAFVNLGISREFENRSKVRVADYDFKEDLSDTLYETGFGFNAFFNDKIGIYANFAAFFGDRVSVPVSTVLGIQMSW